MDAALLPPVLRTVSNCLASVVDVWVHAWVQMDEEERARHAAEFGIAPERLPEVHAWADAHFDKDLVWPYFFLELETAHAFCTQFVSQRVDAKVLGLALAAEDVDGFLERCTAESGGSAGLERRVALRLAPPAGGTCLGSEVLGREFGGSFHSSHCNDLARHFAAHVGTRPNAHGLIDDHGLAQRCAAYTNTDKSGAEPVPWLAFQIREYPRVAPCR